MFLGQYFEIFDWFIIYFTENNGMAFGLELGGELGKLILTLTRIFIVVFAVRYLLKTNLYKYKSPILVCFGLILGGAIGNIIDCLLYGVIFNDSYNNVASMFPKEGGILQYFMEKSLTCFTFLFLVLKFQAGCLSLVAIILPFLNLFLTLQTRVFLLAQLA